MAFIGVIGGGAWGTALASAAQRAGNDVVLCAREADVVNAINREHRNTAFLPDVTLDPAIRAEQTYDWLAEADAVLLVTPAQYLRDTCRGLAATWPDGLPSVICAKGLEIETGDMVSEIVRAELPQAPVFILSGPTFAIEVARGEPTACTLAGPTLDKALALSAMIGSSRFRPYASDDIPGVQIGGAVKNVMAIASGIVSGLGFGDNARAALVTRGLAEITRLGVKLGGRPETLMGLSGMGDLVLTCNSLQSRNFSLGMKLGEGQTLEEILAHRTSVTEGVYTARAVTALASRLGVDMPICQSVQRLLHEGADVQHEVAGLLDRPFGIE